MKLKDGFVLHETEGEYILVATGEASEHFNGYIRLNSTAAFIINKLMDGLDIDEIQDSIVETFDVEKEVAKADVNLIIDKLNSIQALV